MKVDLATKETETKGLRKERDRLEVEVRTTESERRSVSNELNALREATMNKDRE